MNNPSSTLIPDKKLERTYDENKSTLHENHLLVRRGREISGETPGAHPCVSGQTVEEVNAELDQAEEALLDALGDDLPARGIRVVVPGSRRNWIAKNKVAKMRQNLEMGQKEFAALLGTSISTLKKWESGERTPSGAAAKLLEILERNPEAVLTK